MVPEPAPQIIAVTAAGAPGVSGRQLRKMHAPFRGVRVLGELDTRTRAQAGLVGARVDGTLTDLSAAALWRLPLAPRVFFDGTRPVSVAVAATESRAEGRGIRGRRLRLPEAHVTVLDGAKVTTPARTWLDCAAYVPLEWSVAMGDHVLHHGLVSREELRDIVRWGKGRRGVATARLALPLLDPKAESPGESLLRVILVQGGIEGLRCNVDIVGRDGWLARVDLVLETERVIIEFDGRVHITEEQRRYDAVRRNFLQDDGWRVLVFTWGDLTNPWAIVSLVQSAMRSGRRRQ